jgi:RNA polymerase sigma-70 factor (ECF subfamily)
MAANIDRAQERDIVLRIQAGDREAFGLLVSRYMQRAYYGALGLVGSHEDALDLSQEAFVRAYRARATIDAERPFYTWYYQILRRLCFNLGRDRRTRRERLDEASSWLVLEAERRAGHGPEDQSAASEVQARARDAIEQMGETEREVIVLRELQGLSYREISELLEIPIGTVMSRLYSARKNLAKDLVDMQ